MPCFKIIFNSIIFFGSFFDPPNPQQGDAPAGRHPTGTSKDFSCGIESWNSNDTVTGRVAQVQPIEIGWFFNSLRVRERG